MDSRLVGARRTSTRSSASPSDPLFDGSGEMRELCREFDWSSTGLGESTSWPTSLRTTVRILLGSRNPMFLFWGPELIQFYNDAYRPSLGGYGGRHPRALGARGQEFWTDIWSAIGPQIEQVMTTGEATWHEDQYLPIERNDRLDDVWWTYSYGPAYDDDGRVNGVLVVCQETTQRVQAEREKERLLEVSERARAEAESANRVKAHFLTIMSHELRTPLNAIGGYAELLQMSVRGPLNEDQAQFVERIKVSQRHLLGLINGVLSFAKLETGSVSFEITDTAVLPVLVAAQALVEPQAVSRGLLLKPVQCDAGLHVNCDQDKLRQIVVNLLSNAVKFTERGTVTLSCVREGDFIHIAVSDTGIGIAEDAQRAIFDPFVQVHADLTRPYEGTGLGLAISRDLARGMGGDISVSSEPGRGSTFTLTLPCA